MINSMTARAMPDERMKVFISYSRADAGFADQLAAFLDDAGFRPIIDRYDIESAEVWKQRLGALLLGADAVVFILTDRSAGSAVCEWEVEEAARLGKRIVPVVPEPLYDGEAPSGLGERQYIYFYSEPTVPDSGFYDGQKRLKAALQLDFAWLRTQTDLLEQATRWRQRGRAEYLLLRGGALEDALTWRDGAPSDEALLPEIEEFLEASAEFAVSERAASEADRAARDALALELRKARGALARKRKEEKRQQRAVAPAPRAAAPPPRMPPPPRPRYDPPPFEMAPAARPRRRFPVFRTLALLILIVPVVAIAANEDLRAMAREAWREGDALLAAVNAEETPPGSAVTAQDFTPERPLLAGRGGANVRDYPVLSATLLEEAPAGYTFNVTGRLQVQGYWWFRVVLADGRIGFVREDVTVWGARAAPPPPSMESPDAPIAAITGRIGANIRTAPRLNATRIVRLPAGTALTIIGKQRQGEHWWCHVTLEDGRTGYVRDDVLLAPDGSPLAL